MEYINTQKIKFIVNEGEMLKLEYDGKVYPSIKLKRCFPFNNPENFIGIYESDSNQEIGIIYDLKELDEQQYEIAVAELKFRYFMPIITKIIKIKEKPHFAHLDIVTTAGEKNITIQDIPFNINMYSNGQIIIKDVDGNLYEVDVNYLKSNDKNAKFVKNYI